MQCVVLAGGLGTRLAEETGTRPKPMVEIGGQPILWHILKIYSAYGINDFIVCAGYKGEIIRRYFSEYGFQASDVTFDVAGRVALVHQPVTDRWQVRVVDTGALTMTGGRLRRIKGIVGETSFATYGDAVADINLDALLDAHRRSGKLVTMTVVRCPSRFGIAEFSPTGELIGFTEKPSGFSEWINGGFFVIEPSALDRVAGDASVWEADVLPILLREGQLNAYQHPGFWHCMDTLRDRNLLEAIWQAGNPPWRIWK